LNPTPLSFENDERKAAGRGKGKRVSAPKHLKKTIKNRDRGERAYRGVCRLGVDHYLVLEPAPKRERRQSAEKKKARSGKPMGEKHRGKKIVTGARPTGEEKRKKLWEQVLFI